MGKYYTRDTVSEGSSEVSQINAELAKIEAALEDTLSLSGKSPNSLVKDLDAAGYKILNSPNTDVEGSLQTYVDQAEAARDEAISLAVSVKTYGATGDGSTDDTTAIQAAINATASSGGVLHFPEGDYRVTNLTIPSNTAGLTLRGEGLKTRILTTQTTSDIFYGFNTDNVWFMDLHIAAAPGVVMTSGYAIHMKQYARGGLVRCAIAPQTTAFSEAPYGGFHADYFDELKVQSCEVFTKAHGITCNGATDGTDQWGAGLWIGGMTKIRSESGDGLTLAGNAGGVYLGACDIIDCGGVGVKTDLSAGGSVRSNRELFMTSLTAIDTNHGDGIKITTESIAKVTMDGTWVATNGLTKGLGVSVDSPNTGLDLQMTGCRIYNHQTIGCAINGGSATVVGGEFHNNQGEALFFPNSGVESCIVAENIFKGNGTAIKLVGGVSYDKVWLGDNAFSGNTADLDVVDPSIDVTRGNHLTGVTTKTYFAVLDGTGSILIPHGMGASFPGQIMSASAWYEGNSSEALPLTVNYIDGGGISLSGGQAGRRCNCSVLVQNGANW